jgi:predicted glycogen debranching enzyme
MDQYREDVIFANPGCGESGSSANDFEREWLVTNKIGGFAAGTLSELNTRRYHGLLMAALSPPLGRTLLVAKLDVTARYLGNAYPLFCNEFSDGTLSPQANIHLESFHLDGLIPVWRYALADALLEKRIWMDAARNMTFVQFTLLRASATVDLQLRPLCTYRDYHSHSQGGWEIKSQPIESGVEIAAFAGATPYRITCDQGAFTPEPMWYWHFKHRMESERGLDDSEDLFCPGRFTCTLAESQQTLIELSAEPASDNKPAAIESDIHSEYEVLLVTLPQDMPGWIRRLALASDQFIVERNRDAQHPGKTVIAGYPWFGDWGRDTMIALPGLTLPLRRFDVAESILRTFAHHISEGMLPNRFPDGNASPEYNTVDATLWYFHAIDQYTRHCNDFTLAADLYPVLTEIVDWHLRGTRYAIKADPQDGLLYAGVPGVQLTWMDAKVGDWVITPRIGKAVEVNALWYNALRVMAKFSARLGTQAQTDRFTHVAEQVRSGFSRFWNAQRRCLYDVIDGPQGDPGEDGRRYDASLRPNQLLAVSLPESPLNPQQQQAIVDVCAHTLLTPYGLRSLAPGEPDYTPRYEGGPRARDAAYHQGTVWTWLLGPFVDAHYRVYRDAAKARSFLEPISLHLQQACLGQVSEIFDAEAPHLPRGCFAQAWSVAEILRAWLDLSGKA